jgi:hypothetical protein
MTIQANDPAWLKKPIPADCKDPTKFLAFVKSQPQDQIYSIDCFDCPMFRFVGRWVAYDHIPEKFRDAIFAFPRPFAPETAVNMTWGDLAARLEAKS